MPLSLCFCPVRSYRTTSARTDAVRGRRIQVESRRRTAPVDTHEDLGSRALPDPASGVRATRVSVR